MAEQWNWRDHYEDRDKDGHEVLYVQENRGKYVYIVAGIIGVSLYNEHLIPKSKPKTLRPWTFEEVPVGAVVRNKETKEESLIVSKSKGNNGPFVLVPDDQAGIISCGKLLNYFELLDGSPCGVEE